MEEQGQLFHYNQTSCSSSMESKVFFDEVMRSEYATMVSSSFSQNEDLIGSCQQIILIQL